jgi:hypothetical protein
MRPRRHARWTAEPQQQRKIRRDGYWLRTGRQSSRCSSTVRVKNVSSSMLSRWVAWHTQNLILSQEAKQSEREADHSLETSAEINKTWLHIFTPPHTPSWRSTELAKHRVDVTILVPHTRCWCSRSEWRSSPHPLPRTHRGHWTNRETISWLSYCGSKHEIWTAFYITYFSLFKSLRFSAFDTQTTVLKPQTQMPVINCGRICPQHWSACRLSRAPAWTRN